MTLPAAFPLAASQINVELGRANVTPMHIGDVAERGLAGVPAGQIKYGDFLGKSSRGIVQTSSRPTPGSNVGGVSTFNNVDCGAAQAGSRIVVLAFHGDVNTNPGTAPTCTIGGNGTNRKVADSTGDVAGGVNACGTAIFEMDGSAVGGLNQILLTWGSVVMWRSIVVLRCYGYQWGAPTTWGPGGNGDVNLNLPAANYGVIACCASGANAADLVWSGDGIVEKGQESNYGAGADNVRSWAWIAEAGPDASFNVHVAPFSTAQGANSWCGIAMAPA